MSSTRPESTGIWYCKPGTAKECIDQALTHKETVDMGVAQMSLEEFAIRMETLIASDEWRAGKYNLMKHNCNTFCDTLCKELVGHGIPDWVNRLSRWGSGITGILSVLNVADLVSGTPEDADSKWASVSRMPSSSMPVTTPATPRANTAVTTPVTPVQQSGRYAGCVPAMTPSPVKPEITRTGGKVKGPLNIFKDPATPEVWSTPTMSPVALKDSNLPATPHSDEHHVFAVERCTITGEVA